VAESMTLGRVPRAPKGVTRKGQAVGEDEEVSRLQEGLMPKTRHRPALPRATDETESALGQDESLAVATEVGEGAAPLEERVRAIEAPRPFVGDEEPMGFPRRREGGRAAATVAVLLGGGEPPAGPGDAANGRLPLQRRGDRRSPAEVDTRLWFASQPPVAVPERTFVLSDSDSAAV
jgi:hypothetical protein